MPYLLNIRMCPQQNGINLKRNLFLLFSRTRTKQKNERWKQTSINRNAPHSFFFSSKKEKPQIEIYQNFPKIYKSCKYVNFGHYRFSLSCVETVWAKWLEIQWYLLAFCTKPSDDDSWCKSLSTQHDQIMPPEHESTGFPPANTHDMLKPHSKRLPLYLHVCGITVGAKRNAKMRNHQIKKHNMKMR